MYIQDDLLTLETLNISLMFDNKKKKQIQMKVE